MRALVIIALMVASLKAFSEEVNFTVSHIVSGGTIYYHCDKVEDVTEDFLEAFGATDISVRCSGGLDTMNGQWSTPARVRASYVAAEGTQMMAVELEGRRGCHLAHTVFEELSENFVLENVDTGRRCRPFSNFDRWNISFDVLR